MPDETGLRGLLMSARSAFNSPKKGKDVNLEPEGRMRKKKGFLERFSPQDDNTQKAVAQLRSLATPKKR